jgi:hypothetical protein
VPKRRGPKRHARPPFRVRREQPHHLRNQAMAAMAARPRGTQGDLLRGRLQATVCGTPDCPVRVPWRAAGSTPAPMGEHRKRRALVIGRWSRPSATSHGNSPAIGTWPRTSHPLVRKRRSGRKPVPHRGHQRVLTTVAKTVAGSSGLPSVRGGPAGGRVHARDVRGGHGHGADERACSSGQNAGQARNCRPARDGRRGAWTWSARRSRPSAGARPDPVPARRHGGPGPPAVDVARS